MELESVSALGAVAANDVASIRSAIADAWQSTRTVLEVWKQELDPVIWIVSALLALIPGSFAIYKWWTYRNSRLPQRLKEMLEKEEGRLKTVRSELLSAVIRPSSTQVVAAPLFAEPQMLTTIRKLNWARWWRPRPFQAVEAELELALVEMEQQQKFCEQRSELYRSQEATAYLLKGAIASSRATRTDVNSPEQERLNRSALNHFSRALEMEPDNLEILEYVAHQHRALGDVDLALSAYQQLAQQSLGTDRGHRLYRSRALLFLAEMLEKQHDRTQVVARLIEARQNLEDALCELPVDQRGQLHHAAIHEAMARVCQKLGRGALLQRHAQSALAIYSQLAAHEPEKSDAEAGKQRMIRSLASPIVGLAQATSISKN